MVIGPACVSESVKQRTSATGTAWERTPWHATQRAAWEALEQQNCLDTPKVWPYDPRAS
jgi:hypothetical protein